MKSDFDKFVEEAEISRKKFWEIEYPKMNREEKKKYWLAGIHKGMRMQDEAFADPYSEFSKEWYDFAKQNEPVFDSIFNDVVQNLGFEFDWKEYNRRIKN